ncbi:uncharacterized protein MONOS_6105 [Monocercomonoides exilis]|uniref:uncharacterized protein n=1 Tax=Monocercomonoides exilis TaxID=2049356 RepID=UPI00355985BE|nr:hypothetical protein MONOS_6105 [Monocercomonoides exilis]
MNIQHKKNSTIDDISAVDDSRHQSSLLKRMMHIRPHWHPFPLYVKFNLEEIKFYNVIPSRPEMSSLFPFDLPLLERKRKELSSFIFDRIKKYSKSEDFAVPASLELFIRKKLREEEKERQKQLKKNEIQNEISVRISLEQTIHTMALKEHQMTLQKTSSKSGILTRSSIIERSNLQLQNKDDFSEKKEKPKSSKDSQKFLSYIDSNSTGDELSISFKSCDDEADLETSYFDQINSSLIKVRANESIDRKDKQKKRHNQLKKGSSTEKKKKSKFVERNKGRDESLQLKMNKKKTKSNAKEKYIKISYIDFESEEEEESEEENILHSSLFVNEPHYSSNPLFSSMNEPKRKKESARNEAKIDYYDYNDSSFEDENNGIDVSSFRGHKPEKSFDENENDYFEDESTDEKEEKEEELDEKQENSSIETVDLEDDEEDILQFYETSADEERRIKKIEEERMKEEKDKKEEKRKKEELEKEKEKAKKIKEKEARKNQKNLKRFDTHASLEMWIEKIKKEKKTKNGEKEEEESDYIIVDKENDEATENDEKGENEKEEILSESPPPIDTDLFYKRETEEDRREREEEEEREREREREKKLKREENEREEKKKKEEYILNLRREMEERARREEKAKALEDNQNQPPISANRASSPFPPPPPPPKKRNKSKSTIEATQKETDNEEDFSAQKIKEKEIKALTTEDEEHQSDKGSNDIVLDI